MRFVINPEGSNEVLGTYVRTDEDYVVYEDNSGVRSAPEDCVKVVDISRAEMIAEVERLKRCMDDAVKWIGGDTTVGMNSLLSLGVEMVEYAKVMGAALTPEDALTELRRLVDSGGYFRIERAHSARFDMEREAAAK